MATLAIRAAPLPPPTTLLSDFPQHLRHFAPLFCREAWDAIGALFLAEAVSQSVSQSVSQLVRPVLYFIYICLRCCLSLSLTHICWRPSNISLWTHTAK